MPLPSRAVSRLAPLSKHAAVIADADIPHIESVEWSGHDLRQQLVTRGVRLTSLDTKLPSSIHCRLYIIPAIGPWPLLPPTWTVLRANNITAYCNLADVQAYVLRTLRIALPYNYFLPLPHRCISATMELHRPETKEMTEARRYLCSVGGGADSAEGQYEWLVKGDPLLVSASTELAPDCLQDLVYTTHIPGSEPSRKKRRIRPKKADSGADTARSRRKRRRMEYFEGAGDGSDGGEGQEEGREEEYAGKIIRDLRREADTGESSSANKSKPDVEESIAH